VHRGCAVSRVSLRGATGACPFDLPNQVDLLSHIVAVRLGPSEFHSDIADDQLAMALSTPRSAWQPTSEQLDNPDILVTPLDLFTIPR